MQSEIALCAQACLQSDWHMTHAISLGTEWQVNISDNEHICVATGETIEEALMAAQAKAFEGKYAGRLFALSNKFYEAKASSAGQQLLLSLGLTKPKAPIRRRI